MKSPKNFHGLNISKIGRKYFLFYKELSEENGNKGCPILVAQSNDGIVFELSEERMTLKKLLMFKQDLDIKDSFHVAKLEGKYYLFYKDDISKRRTALAMGVSQDGFEWKKFGVLDAVKECATVLRVKKSMGTFLMFFGERNIKTATSPDLQEWNIERLIFLKPSSNGFDNGKISVGDVFLTKEGIVLIYVAQNKKKKWGLGAVLLDKDDYKKVLWRSEQTLWQQPRNWENNKVNFIGVAISKGEILAYWEHKDELLVSVIPQEWNAYKPEKLKSEKKPTRKAVLEKYMGNPIIKPNKENSWESYTTFNPTAVCVDDKVHLLYRAVGENGMSMFGYASSKDGLNVDERLSWPAYVPKEHFEFNGFGSIGYTYPYMSGGGWGGCEDPRLTLLGDEVFLTYTAFNGHQPPGVAMSSITKDDFLNKRWNWRKPQLLSKPGEIQKNWLIFPEKIHGKYAILHSINPGISIEYFDDLDHASCLDSCYNTRGNDNRWDNVVRGAASAPIKTEYGWLLFYHAMDRRDPNHKLGGYWNKVGAMILDYVDPTKILFRSPRPLLEADRHYERSGAVPGAVYVCGSVIKGDDLLVYYGGADTVGCVAKAPLKNFLNFLTNNKNSFSFEELSIA